ncbi:hypothetical protein [Sporomusa termitida]|uniref:hypothetical protein n=1 Tax=Sporomusa termitida TaxID=2377 RepID=UPI0014781B17|nr:hypothetical protein [Sporomusa termitida]
MAFLFNNCKGAFPGNCCNCGGKCRHGNGWGIIIIIVVILIFRWFEDTCTSVF